MEKTKQFMEYKDQKCIKMKGNFVLDLERTAPVTFQYFTGAIEKVMKLYEKQRNDWSIRKVSFVFRIFTFFMCK